jgi:hypothetical protein
MKKILLLLLIFSWSVYPLSLLVWDGSKNSDMNDTANWTGTCSAGTTLSAGDSCLWNAGSVASIASANVSVGAIVTVSGGYTGNISFSGYTLTVANNADFDAGTGTLNTGNGCIMNGASGRLHFGSTLGTVTATACVLTMNGTTGMVLDDDKGITIKQVVNNGTLTNSGAGYTIVQNNGPWLIAGNNSTFINSKYLQAVCTASGDLWVIGTNVVFRGVAEIDVGITSSVALNIPAFTGTGTQTFYFHTVAGYASGGSINLTGNFLAATSSVQFYSDIGTTFTFNTNNYNITCSGIMTGSTLVTAQCTFNYGSSVITAISFSDKDAAYTTGYSLKNYGTSQWFISGNITRGVHQTATHISDVFTVNGTATQTITSNGKQFNDLTVNNSGTGTVKFADALSLIGDLTLTDGRDTFSLVSCDDYYNATNDSVFQTDSLKLTASYYRNNAKIKRTAGVIYFYGTSNGTINLVDAGIMGITVINRPGKTITTLSTTRFSQLRNIAGTFIAANPVTDSTFINLDSAAWQADHTIFLRDSSGVLARNSYTAGIWRTYGTGADTGKVWCGSANKGNIVVNAGAKGWKFNDTVKCLIKKRLAGRVEEKHPMQCTAIIDSCASGDSLITDSSRTITGADANGNALVRIAGVKVSRGPAMVNRFTGSVDQGVLSNGGAIAPVVCRKTGGTLQFKDAQTITRIIDSAGGLISFADNSTVDSIYTVSVGVKYTVTAGKTLTVTGLNGIGGTSGHPDTLTGTAAWNLALTGTQSLTLSYLYVKNCQLSAGDSLILTDGTSIDGGGNSGNVKFPEGSNTARRHRGWFGLGLWLKP